MRIFTHEDGEWTIKGRFRAALGENDPIIWDVKNGEYSLSIALVCIHL